MTAARKVLIIGAGSIGRRHARCFRATGQSVVSVCEVDARRRRQVAEECAAERAYAELDEALADPPDAAVIAVPAPLHVSMAIRLAEVGAHLLIEKPLSTSLEGIGSLVETVSQHNVVAAVAYVYRAHPVLGAMREAIRSGRFGAPVQLIVAGGQHFPTYRPAYREIYYRDRATGGGAIQDALTHVMDIGRWLVGPIDCVVADAAHQVLEGVTVEDTVNVLARHGDLLASYSLNQYQAPNELTVSVVCRGATCRFELHRSRWRWLDTPDGSWHDEPHDPLERDSLFILQAQAFLDAVEGRRPPLCPLEEGIEALAANLAVLASTDGRSWQTIQDAARGAKAAGGRQ